MPSVSYAKVMEWLDYWDLAPQRSYKKWDTEFNHIPPPPPDPSSYEEAATWISENYDGPLIPSPSGPGETDDKES